MSFRLKPEKFSDWTTDIINLKLLVTEFCCLTFNNVGLGCDRLLSCMKILLIRVSLEEESAHFLQKGSHYLSLALQASRTLYPEPGSG